MQAYLPKIRPCLKNREEAGSNHCRLFRPLHGELKKARRTPWFGRPLVFSRMGHCRNKAKRVLQMRRTSVIIDCEKQRCGSLRARPTPASLYRCHEHLHNGYPHRIGYYTTNLPFLQEGIGDLPLDLCAL